MVLVIVSVTVAVISLLQVGEWRPSTGLVMKTATLVRQKGNNTILNRTRIVTSILVGLSASVETMHRKGVACAVKTGG